MDDLTENLPEIEAVHFVALSGPCYRTDTLGPQTLSAQYALPATKALTGEGATAKVFLAWHPEGLAVMAQVRKAVSHVVYPDIESGDSLEIFLDTRDVKTSGYNTRFCHHFFFLPRDVEGHQKGEKTHFRGEEAHELCPPDALQLAAKETKSSHEYRVFIPARCLHGYDPQQVKRLGFTYRINLFDRASQHFSALSRVYDIEQQPSLWASLSLEESPS